MREDDEPGRRRSIARSKDKSRDEKYIDGQSVLPLLDMKVSPMQLSYNNDNLEDQEGVGHVTRPDEDLELTDHASIPTGITPAKMTPRYLSDSFDDEGQSINTNADTKVKEPVVSVNQDSVCGRPKWHNGYAQLVQLK